VAIWHAFRHAADSGLALVLVPSPRAAGETAARNRGIVPKSGKVSVTHARTADGLELRGDDAHVVVATPQAPHRSADRDRAVFDYPAEKRARLQGCASTFWRIEGVWS